MPEVGEFTVKLNMENADKFREKIKILLDLAVLHIDHADEKQQIDTINDIVDLVKFDINA